ncbi:MAG: Stk1 family PASTA domain-containing Ser/Thr kinase [Pseudonocardiaceae bacterium]
MERQVPGRYENLVGTLLDGRYRVGPVLARGGMSTVYRGTDTRLERPVAIKVMDPRLAADPSFLQRFEREARAAARLHHPGIVGVYDQGMDSRGPSDPTGAASHVFLVMELVEGGTLRDLLREHGRLPVPLALTVTGLVLSALAAAHREGLVHRDVKPENVLIGPGGVLKVADFGLVRAAAEAGNNTGDLILGTVAYLSPEQVATGTADPRSDVYATGVLLFEMLTGAPPYTGETALSVAYRHVNDDAPAPGTVGPPVPAPLDDLVVRATRRDPAARPADASAFLFALQQVRAELGIAPVGVPLPAAAAALAGAATTHPRVATGWTAAAAGARTAVASPPADHGGPRGTRALARTQLPTGGPGTRRGGPPPAPTRYEPPGGPPDDDPYQRERVRNRRAFIAWIMIVLLLASVVGVAAWWLGSGRWTAVPDLTGLQRTAVEAALAEAHLEAALTEDHHNSIRDGIVISSDPGSGNRVLRGSDVTVRLSLGRPVVPDLPVGTPADDAERMLHEVDLSPRSDPAAAEFHDTVPPGAVIGLRPASGTVLTVGAPVTLVISKGPAPTTVPEVRGIPEADAIAALGQAGLTAQVRREFDDEVPGGQAIGTDPEAGDETSRGSDVTLLVSTALVVPEVVGQPREQALDALTGAGFEPQERGDGAGAPGATVLSVQPRAGSLVPPSDNAVTVRLSTRVVVPNVVGMPVGQARQVLADAGLDSEVSRFIGGSSSRVIAQFPGAGRAVQPGTTVRLMTF